MFEHTQDQNVRTVASKLVDLSAAHLILGMAIKIVIWPEAQRDSYTRFSPTAINVSVPRCLQSKASSASRRRWKSNVHKWMEPQRRRADDVTTPNIRSAVSLKDFHIFHLFIISLLLLFFFCSTELFLPLLCIITIVISLSDKTAVDYNNDIYFFLSNDRISWVSMALFLAHTFTLRPFLAHPSFSFAASLFSIFYCQSFILPLSLQRLPRRSPRLQHDGQIVVWTEVC